MAEHAEITRRLAAAVDADRLWSRLMAMAEIGAIGDGGVNRQALSCEDIAARQRLLDWGAAIGLAPAVDGIANLFLRYRGRQDDEPPILLGSHMDSQPRGGRFDGIYGVLAALEVLQAMAVADMQPRRPVELVAWTNEEGSRFAPGAMGSAVFAGLQSLDDLRGIRDGEGTPLSEALRIALAATPDVARRDIGFPVAGYLEAHIEQGPLLEEAGVPVGAVTGIQGSRLFEVEVVGESAHAGTTPRASRRDALQAAVRLIAALDGVLRDTEDVLRFTVGRLRVSPNTPNSVPEFVAFSIDLRHPDAEVLEASGQRIRELCAAHDGLCGVRLRKVAARAPCRFPASVVDAVEAGARDLAIPCQRMESGAFHDAQSLHTVCPAGMVFVPCHRGISHHPAEYAAPTDLASGTRVLAAAAWRLAQAG